MDWHETAKTISEDVQAKGFEAATNENVLGKLMLVGFDGKSMAQLRRENDTCQDRTKIKDEHIKFITYGFDWYKREYERLLSRRICSTCEGSGIAVYGYGPNYGPNRATVLWAEAKGARKEFDELMEEYDESGYVGDPGLITWHETWFKDVFRAFICRHCGGTGMVEVAR